MSHISKDRCDVPHCALLHGETGVSIAYLAALVHKKNTINLRRRRFWNLAFGNYYWTTIIEPDVGVPGQYKKIELCIPKCYSKDYLVAGYEQAKRDMKALTKEMRRVRKELGASFTWDESGNIYEIRFEDFDMSKEQIKLSAWCYQLDQELEQ